MQIRTFVMMVCAFLIGGCSIKSSDRAERTVSEIRGIVMTTHTSHPGALGFWETSVASYRQPPDTLVVKCEEIEAILTIASAFQEGRRRGWMMVAMVAYNPLTARASGDPGKRGIGNCRIMTHPDFLREYQGVIDKMLILPDPPRSFIRSKVPRINNAGTAPTRFMSDGITRG